MASTLTLAEKYPPSPPCSCDVCLAYCSRPGWWTVAEAAAAIQAGYGNRMMLEMAPDLSFGVLSPAFHGCESAFAENRCASNGCNFLEDNLCTLHGTGHQPLECRFCHHERRGQGPVCHADLEKDWNSSAGRRLVVRWSRQAGLWEELQSYGFDWLDQGTKRVRHGKSAKG
jgi:hypothetical protein